jgi:electron transport complex protein RnfC
MAIERLRTTTFPGGTHPPECKELTVERRITPGPPVKQVTIMLSQHIGAPCNPLVNKGDTVEAGQKVGDSDAFVSAPVHTPIAGKVKDISLQPHAVLGRALGIVIEAAEPVDVPKPDAFESFGPDFDETQYTSERICDAVRRAGLVGMGGAGFPTRVKIEPNPRLPKSTMIINACECEPYITCDNRVMIEWVDQVIAGIKLASRASGCEKVYIGIEDNKPRATMMIAHALERSVFPHTIQVVPVKTKYPQGGERQLIRAIMGRHVPTGGIPPMIGVLVLNVATAAAIAEAVVLDRPLTHRIVTVSGQALAEPSNLYVPIGTAVGDLIEFCGGATEKSAKVVCGGPMMGVAIADFGMPITKTTGAITVLTKKQIGRAKFRHQQTPCIRCGRCLEVCPEYLNPTKIAHAIKNNAMEMAENYYMNACIECGCCSYVCPANIELTGYIHTGKITLARQKKMMPE